MTFKSAVDWWFYAAVALVVVGCGISVFASFMEGGPVSILVGLLINILLIGFMLSFLVTRYTIASGVLRIRCGVFSTSIPISEIRSVTPSRALFAGPALSLDRLKIRYGIGNTVLVSPADKEGFLKALGLDLDAT
jgi:uncharacterized membrane protein YdbT with pleckstrin-like domain